MQHAANNRSVHFVKASGTGTQWPFVAGSANGSSEPNSPAFCNAAQVYCICNLCHDMVSFGT